MEMCPLSVYNQCVRVVGWFPKITTRVYWWQRIIGLREMSFHSSYEDCPIAGTFCRMRWFLRYARGEGRLCRLSNPILIER
jgi:hypothetical protein